MRMQITEGIVVQGQETAHVILKRKTHHQRKVQGGKVKLTLMEDSPQVRFSIALHHHGQTHPLLNKVAISKNIPQPIVCLIFSKKQAVAP